MGLSLPVPYLCPSDIPPFPCWGPATHLRTFKSLLLFARVWDGASVQTSSGLSEEEVHPADHQSLLCASRARWVSTRLRTTAQCPGIPPPQPPRLLIYILHSDWPESSLLFMILPDTMVRGGVHIVFSPTRLDFSVQPAKPCLGMFKDLSLFCLEV